MTDDDAEKVLLAVQELALIVRDEGPHAVRRAAQRVLAAAGGDPIAAVVVAAAALDVDHPVTTWWRSGPTLKVCTGCGQSKTLSEFVSDRSRADGFAYQCKVCRADTRCRRTTERGN